MAAASAAPGAQRLASGEKRRRRRRPIFPWTLYRYVITEVLRVMMLSLVAISLAATVVLAFQLVRSGIRLGFLWPVLFKALAYPCFFSMPVAALFGVTLGAGRLAGDQEISAMKVNGLSYLQLAIPVLILGGMLAGAAWWINGEVVPEVHYEKGNLREAILGQLEDLGSGKNRSLLLPSEGRLFVESYQGTRLRGISLELREDIGRKLTRGLRDRLGGGSSPSRSQRMPLTFWAKECDLEIALDQDRVFLNLYGVDVLTPQMVTAGERGPDIFRQRYSVDNLRLALSFHERGESVKDQRREELARYRSGLEEKIASLEQDIESLANAHPEIPRSARQGRGAGRKEGATVSDAAREMQLLDRELESLRRKSYVAATEEHRRWAFALGCFTFPVIGLPLVLLADRRSRLVPFFFGNVFVVLPFFLLVMVGVLLGERGFPAPLAMALPNLLLGGGAIYLWSKVIRG